MYAACSRVKQFPHASIPGAQKRPCSKCGRRVWCSPSTMSLVREGRALPACLQCCAHIITTSGEEPQFFTTPEAMVELDGRSRRESGVPLSQARFALAPELSLAIDLRRRRN